MADQEKNSTKSLLRRSKALLLGSVAMTLGVTLVIGHVTPAIAQTTASGSGGSSAITFNIRAQDLGSALNAFADRAGLRLLFPSGLASGRQSAGLSGTYSREQGLAQLLAGTGLSYRFTSRDTVTINSPSAGGAGIDGAIQLDTIDVSGGRGGASSSDAPFRTPGSSAYISRETLDRVPPISAGDVFITTPGVISAGNRVGTSVNPNIRGLQGMGRINTTVDGARQTSSSYRGYIGNRDETFIDPDMISGIDITKGPSEGVGSGGIGGSVNFRTLEAGDIVKEGKTHGVRIKGSLGSNTVTPSALSDIGIGPKVDQLAEKRPSPFNGDAYSGNFAVAVLKEQYEFVAAYSKRVQGNYFVGTKVPAGVVFPRTNDFAWNTVNANAAVLAGAEAFNTSENTDSFLAKGKVKWGDGQSLELGYLYFGSRYGEIDELSFTPAQAILPYGQFPLSNTRVDTYTAKYKHKPSDNPYVNFRANLWMSDVASERKYGALAGPYGIRTTGGDIGNASIFGTPFGELTVDTGLEVTRENAEAQQFATSVTGSEGWMSFGPSGVRLMSGAFSKASLKATDWLTLSAGARYDYFNSEGEGYLTKFPERSGGRLSPNAGVVLTPFDGLQFYAQYKEGYRPPSLRETHWHYEGLLVNNPDLRPEISKNKEVGVNVLRNDVLQPGDKLRVKFSYFDNHYDDYIIRLLRSNNVGNVYHWNNLDSANYRGFEISGGYDVGAFFVEGAFTKYTHVEYCPTASTCSIPATGGFTAPGAGGVPGLANDYMSNYIPPEYSGSVTAGIRLFDQKLTLGARTHFSSTRIGSTWPTAGMGGQVGSGLPWPAYRIYDVFGSYKFNDDNILSFSVENITDEYYFGALSSAGIPSPGRTAKLSYSTTLSDTKPVFSNIKLGNASHGAPGGDWTGLYVGGHLGYGFARIKGTTTTADGSAGGIAATESANLNLRDLTAGFQGGLNYQFANRFVLGVEAESSWTKLKGYQESLAMERASLAAGHFLQANTTYDLDWFATLRGRIGYAFDRTLFYGAAGLALLRESETRTQYESDTSFRQTTWMYKEGATATRRGWTAAGGLEYALTNNWSLKGEYSFAHFGTEDFLFPSAKAGVVPQTSVRTCVLYFPPPRQNLCRVSNTTIIPGSSQTTNGRKAMNELDLHAFKIGLNYRF